MKLKNKRLISFLVDISRILIWAVVFGIGIYLMFGLEDAATTICGCFLFSFSTVYLFEAYLTSNGEGSKKCDEKQREENE